MIEYNAVLVIGMYVVSIFNVPLGAPAVQQLPYKSLEDCMFHAQMYEGAKAQIDLEWTVVSKATCLTKEQHDQMQADLLKQQQQLVPNNE